MYDYDYDYSLFEHKKSDTVKWVLTLVAFLIVGVMLAGIICGWFEKEEKQPQEEQQEQTLYQRDAYSDRGAGYGIG